MLVADAHRPRSTILGGAAIPWPGAPITPSAWYEGQNPGQTYVVDAACLFGPTNTYRLAVVDGQLKLSNNHKNMLWIITFVPLWIAIGRCAIRCNTSSHPPDGLVVMFEKTSSIKGLLVPGVLPL